MSFLGGGRAGALTPTIDVNRAACTACGVCIEICPTDVLAADPDTGKPWAAYREDCQVCFLCEIDCPAEAIRVWPR
jgi:NAD-dependent dihydropyrimidine dehydrogenase PreA subunit